MANTLLKKLWDEKGFKPNSDQEKAILYDAPAPLFITAAPGSGKTRVLLWRTVNLIVEKNVSPDRIFLSTFTEKAAFQLKEGLKELLGIAANLTGKKYDLARMFVGTIHSNCHRILLDRNFSAGGARNSMPSIMDELGQYMYIYRPGFWGSMMATVGWEDSQDTNRRINQFLDAGMHKNSGSRHYAVLNLLKFFNRLSEELVDPLRMKSKDPFIGQLFQLYQFYVESLNAGNVPITDLSLVQAAALNMVQGSPQGKTNFQHVIIDEYQDTNTVQEKLVFALAHGVKNLCVVGDDDQALYRFRGSTVENFVDFPNRCQDYYGISPEKISLHTNYRSLNHVVDVFQSFMQHVDWSDGGKSYRIPKTVVAYRNRKDPAVFVTDETHPEQIAPQIAQFVKQLKERGKITDYNQVAVLFSYLKGNENVTRLSAAFEAEGIPVYAPRAGCFLDLDESVAVFGLMGAILGMPAMQGQGMDMDSFRDWARRCQVRADELIAKDDLLQDFVANKIAEIGRVRMDHKKLMTHCVNNHLDLKGKISDKQLLEMSLISGLSRETAKKLSSQRLLYMVQNNHPKATVGYVVNRVTSLDWGLLDLFYQLTMFSYFRSLIDLAASGEDEGPICNLSLLTQYISRYQENRGRPILTGGDLAEDRFQRQFFMSYLFAMYRLGETEFEDADDPFPKGRVSFITIHQAKGLEFPVVILGSIYRRSGGPDVMEQIVRDELGRQGEPLDRTSEFDNARLFYVALSRAKNVLVLPRYSGRGIRRLDVFKRILSSGLPHLNTIEWDKIDVTDSTSAENIGRTYSFTADYLVFKRCPRQYMLFRKYEFVPARSSLMLFGSLIHQTLEDLHNYILAQKRGV